MQGLVLLTASAMLQAGSQECSSWQLRSSCGGEGFSLLVLQSFFAAMQNHLVTRAFISCLLVMVVENGGQNCIHLGELLLEPFALYV